MNFLVYIYYLKGDEIFVKNILNRFYKIIGVIMLFGNGEKCEMGFYVILVSYEYILFNFFGF